MKTILEYLINKSTKEKHIDLNKVPKDYNEFLEQIKEYHKKYNIELIYLYGSDDKGNLTVKSKNYTFSRRIKRLRININDEYLVTTQQESTGRSITDPNKIDKYCEYAIYKALEDKVNKTEVLDNFIALSDDPNYKSCSITTEQAKPNEILVSLIYEVKSYKRPGLKDQFLIAVYVTTK